ncbi:hypothetical protein JRQ81_006294 [Phrynocephalus forsythii]|uniref:MARVEL domain-containing protein n=1 Tax=Phrynocephalus forsythii TaxID=171643 RepID=A0A9Q1AU79_9SAUR|nr:hypothetical protein JRQ81_006294 [Phrynocephalus forsythii]
MLRRGWQPEGGRDLYTRGSRYRHHHHHLPPPDVPSPVRSFCFFAPHFRSLRISVSLFEKAQKRKAAIRASQGRPSHLCKGPLGWETRAVSVDGPVGLLSKTMERVGGDESEETPPPGARLLLSVKEFLGSRKGLLLLAEAGLSFIIFICYIASAAAPFLMVPLLTFLLALCFFFAYSLKLNKRFKAVYWILADFLCGIIAAIIYFAISIAAVSKYSDTASKAAGVFGFIVTIVYCIYVYLTFNSLTTYLKQEDSTDAPEPRKPEEDDSDSDSD